MPSRLLGATFINKPVALFVKSANAVQSVYLIKTGDSLICTYMYMYIGIPNGQIILISKISNLYRYNLLTM